MDPVKIYEHDSEKKSEKPITLEDDIIKLFDNELKEFPQVYKFIQKLQEMVERQRKLLYKYHEKFKQLKKEVQHVGVQSDMHDILQHSMPTDEKGAVDINTFKEEIVQAAHSAVQKSGFVYEPVSGLYYDYNTGYYYNSELGLYYDGSTCSYYYYNEKENKFEFHSQVQTPSSQHITNRDNSVKVGADQDSNKSNKALISSFKHTSSEPSKSSQCVVKPLLDTDILSDVSSNSDLCDDSENVSKEDKDTHAPLIQTKLSDSEITSHSVESDLIGRFSGLNLDIASVRIRALEIANAWPPCLRIIVMETSVKGLRTGTLFLVTCLGGTVGREGEHAVLIPDINISKHHAKIEFTGTESNKEDPSKGYTLVDLGSRNGTYADGIRLSAALQESEPHLLRHGTELRIGSTKLSVHIHQGRDTCDQCEPGVLMGGKNKAPPAKVDLSLSSSQNRQAELKRLRKKFGLDKNTCTKVKASSTAYEDRAERRRQTVGSLVEGEKTQVANIEERIPNENKGFRMLSKMGWKSGQTLGKDEANTSALIEPIIPQQYAKKAGLGSSMSTPIATLSNPKDERKKTVWEKTQARYNVLEDEPPSTI